MSTQTIQNKDTHTIINEIDNEMICVGNKMVISDKFGTKESYSASRLSMLVYYKRLLNDRGCTEVNINKESIRKFLSKD